MRFKLFPSDLEGVGCVRVLYPYAMMERNGGHSVVMDIQRGGGRMALPVPAAAVGGKFGLDAVDFLSQADVFVLQRPLQKVYAPLAAWLKTNGKMVVVDLDDFYHGIPPGNQGAKAVRRSKIESVEALDHVLRYTDLLTVSTERLAELYGPKCGRVVVLKNKLLKGNYAFEPSFSQERDKIRIGWMGWMSFRSSGDLRIIKPVLQKFLRRHPECVFVNVGKHDAVEYLATPRSQTWSFKAPLYPNHFKLVGETDIGLVPLARNTFNECKSYLKGMEYGGCGSAIVASPLPEYQEWVDEGHNGFLARSTDEWLDVLEWLVRDDNWRGVAKANHEKAMDHLIDDHWTDWEDAYAPALA